MHYLVINENLKWAETHGTKRSGAFYCRKSGAKLGMYEIKIEMLEVNQDGGALKLKDLQAGRVIEPVYIHHFCCHSCGEQETIRARFLSTDLEFGPAEISPGPDRLTPPPASRRK